MVSCYGRYNLSGFAEISRASCGFIGGIFCFVVFLSVVLASFPPRPGGVDWVVLRSFFLLMRWMCRVIQRLAPCATHVVLLGTDGPFWAGPQSLAFLANSSAAYFAFLRRCRSSVLRPRPVLGCAVWIVLLRRLFFCVGCVLAVFVSSMFSHLR